MILRLPCPLPFARLAVGAVVAVAAVFGVITAAVAQDAASAVEVATRAPRFLRGLGPDAAPIDPAEVSALRQRIALPRRVTTLDTALRVVAQRAGVRIQYSRDVVPLQRQIRFEGGRISLAAALTDLLLGTGVDVRVANSQELVLVRRAKGAGITLAGTITGRVTDSVTGRGIVSAEVGLDGTRWRTHTDSAGGYRLTAVDAGTYTLTARRFGYARRGRRMTIRADQDTTVDLALPAVAAKLDELVTTATGRQRRLDVPNDIATLKVDSIMGAAPIHSVTDLLEHRVPGVTVQRTSGAPGDPARIRIRGAASPLQNNDPIVVVDGMRFYGQQSASRSGNLAQSNIIGNNTGDVLNPGDRANPQVYATPSPLDYIDPNSIETIEVVKGPSATTLYGPDAANGVIVITTKKGHAGPTRWTANADYGRSQMAERYPDLLFRWGHDPFDGATNMYCPISGTISALQTCVGDSVRTFQMLNDPALTALARGHTAGLALGVSGGTQAVTYAISGTFGDQLGMVKLPAYEAERYRTIEGQDPPDWMRRPERLRQWGATTQIGMRLGAVADVSLTATLSRTKQQRSNLERQLPRLMSTYLDRASGTYYTVDEFGSVSNASSYNIAGYRQRATDAATQFTNGLTASWRPHAWLTLNATAGLNVQLRADEVFLPTSRDSTFLDVGGGSDHSGTVDVGTGTTVTSTVNLGGVATAPLGHGIQFRFASGVNYINTSISDGAATTSGVPYGTSLIGTGVNSFSRTLRDDATFGWYVEPSITHPRFSVNLGLRLDGGSAYGSRVNGFKMPTFPKLGFTYVLSEEPWFPLKSLVQSFRVRTAYGRAGTQPGATSRLRLYGTTHLGLGDSGVTNVVELASLGNSELRPERTSEFEGGFDADLLDSRLSVSLTGYRKTKNDALLDVPLAPSVYGNDVAITRNIGVIRNTGLTVEADAQLLRSGGMVWSTRFTVSRNRSKVVRLGPGVEPFYTDLNSATSNLAGGTRVVAGYPLFGRWSTPVLGYADANGDGLLEPAEIVYGDTAVYVGQQEPGYEATVQPTVSLWHGALTLTGMLSHTGGLSQRNEVAQRLAPFSRGMTDPSASLAEQFLTGTAVSGTDFNWIQTASTTRLDDLSVSFTMPERLARHLGAQQLSIAVQGSNLGLWTNYRGLDPNVNTYGYGNSVTDRGILPMPRSWQLRIHATY